jgi:hypothetical protein
MQFQMNKAGQLVQNQTNFILYDQRMNLIQKRMFLRMKKVEKSIMEFLP